MDLETLRLKAERAGALAARERAACARTLAGMRPSGRRWSKRVRRVSAPTAAVVVVERNVGTIDKPETVRETVHLSRVAYAGRCTEAAIDARREYETELARIQANA